MKIKRAGIITKIILLAIVLYAAVRLAMIHAETRDLQAQIASGKPGLLDDCYVAVFDGR